MAYADGYMIPRATGHVLGLAGLTFLVACGQGPAAPSPVPGPAPGPLVFRTTVRVVSATGEQHAVPQAGLSVANGPAQQTDGAGLSVIQAASPAILPLRLAHAEFLERETSVRVPDDRAVDVSLIPSSHDATAFEEFSPRANGLRRWTSHPRLLVLSHAVDYGGASDGFRSYPVLDRAISSSQRDCLAAGVAASLGEMSGGHLTFDSVGVAEVEPGTRFRTDATPEGTIVVLPAVALGAGGRGIGYSGADPYVLTRGAVWMHADLNYCVTSLLYRHEVGHALGYMHVTRTTSIMALGLPPGLTGFDRDSIAILFQRRPGNRLPDRDPSGVSLNLTGAARYDAEPMR